MARFDLVTIEHWEHRVEYYDVEADSLADAVDQIRAGEISCGDHSTTGEGDQLLFVSRARQDGQAIEVPPELYNERNESSDALILLRRLVEWQREMGSWEAPVWREAEALAASAGQLQAAPARRRRIAVILEGGLVQDVVTDCPELVGLDVITIDYDDCLEDERSQPVRQGDGTYQLACIGGQIVEPAAIDLEAIEQLHA